MNYGNGSMDWSDPLDLLLVGFIGFCVYMAVVKVGIECAKMIARALSERDTKKCAKPSDQQSS